MPYCPAPRCRHIKVNGTQCGSPSLRNQNLCFYHQQNRLIIAECYSDIKYATGEINLPPFEDAYSIQTVIRQVVQMVLQKRIERKTASLLLYALKIASSNLKLMENEKPQPAQVVTEVETVSNTLMAAPVEEKADEDSDEYIEYKNVEEEDENLPPGTIQACHRPRLTGRKPVGTIAATTWVGVEPISILEAAPLLSRSVRQGGDFDFPSTATGCPILARSVRKGGIPQACHALDSVV